MMVNAPYLFFSPLQISVADPCLLQPILAMQGDRLVVNLHPTIPLLIRESKCMAKMSIEIPIVAATLLFRQDYFDTISDSLNVRPLFLLSWFASVGRIRGKDNNATFLCPLRCFLAFDKNVSRGSKAG